MLTAYSPDDFKTIHAASFKSVVAASLAEFPCSLLQEWVLKAYSPDDFKTIDVTTQTWGGLAGTEIERQVPGQTTSCQVTFLYHLS